MVKKYTEEQVRDVMVKRITEALYPILIPFEQQCMRIQAENREQIEKLANDVWLNFISKD